MATPNYSFEKRRRELEKKAKNEEKRKQKLAAKAGGNQTETPEVEVPPQATDTPD